MNIIQKICRYFTIKEVIFFKYLSYLFKLCGIYTIDITIQTSNNKKTFLFTHSRKNIVISLIIISLTLTLNSLSFWLKTYGYKNFVIYEVVDTYAFVSVTCILVIFCFNNKRQISILKKIIHIRDDITSENENYEEKSVIKKFKRIIFIHILLWLGTMMSMIFLDLRRAMIYFILDMNHFVVNTIVIQYSIVVSYVKHLIKQHNQKLIHKMMIIDPFNGLLPAIIKIDDNLTHFWKLHLDLTKLSREISNFYSIAMMFAVIGQVLSLTALTYIIAKPLFFGNIELYVIMECTSGFIFIFAYLSPLVWLTTSVSSVVREVK